jgi:hypothetical protein
MCSINLQRSTAAYFLAHGALRFRGVESCGSSHGIGFSTLKHTSSVTLSPRANYTDWATATCRRNLVPTFVDRGGSRGQRGGSLTVVNLSFFLPEPLLFFQVAPHLSSEGPSGPRSRPTATQKFW